MVPVAWLLQIAADCINGDVHEPMRQADAAHTCLHTTNMQLHSAAAVRTCSQLSVRLAVGAAYDRTPYFPEAITS